MGQQCCTVATNDEIYVAKSLSIQQNQFAQCSQFDKSDSFLRQKIPNIQEAQILKNLVDNRYFIGNWQNGQAQGSGTLYIPENLFYQGSFQKGIPSGQGQMIFLYKNQQYRGQFLDGKANGHGLYKNNKKKYSFEGQWKESKPLKGIMFFQDNPNILKIQIEEFQMGKAHVLYKDLRQYHGFINQQLFVPEGNGQLTFSDGSKYKGEWKNGVMHGFGVYQWKDGSKYEGSYVNGKKQGNGIFYYTSGKQYVGMWANGKQQGQGKLITKDGSVQKQGIWKEGSFQRKQQIQQQKQPKVQKELNEKPQPQIDHQ